MFFRCQPWLRVNFLSSCFSLIGNVHYASVGKVLWWPGPSDGKMPGVRTSFQGTLHIAHCIPMSIVSLLGKSSQTGLKWISELWHSLVVSAVFPQLWVSLRWRKARIYENRENLNLGFLLGSLRAFKDTLKKNQGTAMDTPLLFGYGQT